MLYQEGENVELKEVVVDDIKKRSLPLQIVTVVSSTSVYGMMAQLLV